MPAFEAADVHSYQLLVVACLLSLKVTRKSESRRLSLPQPNRCTPYLSVHGFNR